MTEVLNVIASIYGFVTEYWLPLGIFLSITVLPKLLLFWGMARNPHLTVLVWTILMAAFTLWAETLTLTLTHLRGDTFWWVCAVMFFTTGTILAVVAALVERNRHLLAVGVSIVMFANGAFIAPLSQAWHSLTWMLIGMGVMLYIALFSREQRKEERNPVDLRVLDGEVIEAPKPRELGRSTAQIGWRGAA